MISVSVGINRQERGNFNHLEAHIREAAVKGLSKGAQRIVEDAKRRVRDQTSGICELERSIHANVDHERLTATVSADAPHAVFVEFGTRYQEARPFLSPALEENRGAVAADVADAISKALKAFNK